MSFITSMFFRSSSSVSTDADTLLQDLSTLSMEQQEEDVVAIADNTPIQQAEATQNVSIEQRAQQLVTTFQTELANNLIVKNKAFYEEYDRQFKEIILHVSDKEVRFILKVGARVIAENFNEFPNAIRQYRDEYQGQFKKALQDFLNGKNSAFSGLPYLDRNFPLEASFNNLDEIRRVSWILDHYSSLNSIQVQAQSLTNELVETLRDLEGVNHFIVFASPSNSEEFLTYLQQFFTLDEVSICDTTQTFSFRRKLIV